MSILPYVVHAEIYGEEQDDWEQLSGSAPETEFSQSPVLSSSEDLGEVNSPDSSLFPEGEENWNAGGETEEL